MNYKHLYPRLLRFADGIREKHRWSRSSLSAEPRVYYGQKIIPGRGNLLSGGLVKLQDLVQRFPNHTHKPNILYLVSSSLPPNSDILVEYARNEGIPIVLNQNGVAYPAWHGPGWEETNKRLAAVYQQATFIVFQSQFCQLSANRYLGTAKVPYAVLYNPIDTEQFKPLSINRPGHPVKLLVAGSHNFFYKIATAIDVMAYLARQEGRFTLQIAGRCCWKSSEDDCHKEILEYSLRQGVRNQVQLTGSYTQNEAIKIFQTADILLHPTYNDACPRLVVEAMSCGTPVVYSATGGTPELIPEDAGIGVRGSLDWNNIVPPNPEDLGQAILTILGSYSLFSKAARIHTEQKLNVETWLRKHGQIFHALLAEDLSDKHITES